MRPGATAAAGEGDGMNPVHWSSLSRILKSPAHYRYWLDKEVEETAAMRVGSFVHKMMLGGHRTFELFDGHRRGRAWDEFKQEHADSTILNRREWDLSKAIADALEANEEAMTVLRYGDKEKPLSWRIGNRECAGTPDVIGDGLTELKITADASPDRFPWHARRMGWLGQVAWYENGASQYKPQRLSIVAVEMAPPHVSVVYDLDEQATEEAHRTWRAAWERLMLCEENNHWPGYVEGIAVLSGQAEPQTIIIDGEEMEVA